MIDYTYDGINRLTQKKLTTDTPIYTNYDYKASDRGTKYTTSLIETEKLDKTTYKYYYDIVGNITKIDKGSGAYRSYTYDKKNQLLSEVNSTNGVTTNFTYDSLGNITKKVQSGAENETVTYSYGKDADAGWNHILTGITTKLPDGTTTTQTIDYDSIGNPTTYLGATLSWYGRQLKSYTKGSTNVSYTYDSDGLRGTKIYNGTKSTYHYVSGQLRYEARGNLKFYYFYDAYGTISAIRYYPNSTSGYMYYPLVNSQGDVIALYDSKGTCVVTYEYDAWGNCTIVSDTSGRNIGELNPIRYRGYYYDSETGLYYLQSRYYDPQVGRFLNADGYITTGQGVLSYNMFAYCGNNPVMCSDPSGYCWLTLAKIIAVALSSLLVNRIVKYAILGREIEPITKEDVVESIITNQNDMLGTLDSINSGGESLFESEQRKETHAKNLANAAWAEKNNHPFYAESIDTGYFANNYEYSQYCLSLANTTNLYTNGLSWDSLCNKGKSQDVMDLLPAIDENYHYIVRRDGVEMLLDMFS